MASELMQACLDAFKQAGPKTNKGTFEEQRADLDSYTAHYPVPDSVQTRDFTLAGRPARDFIPGQRPGDASPDAGILYLHGGGFCVGSINSTQALTAELALHCDCTVTSLDYRLAPENPYPAGLDDAVAAFCELAERTDPSRLMIAGDSAGGGLALACAQRLNAGNLPLPACVTMFSPATDQSAQHYSADVEEGQWDNAVRVYVGENDPKTPGISPVYGEMKGLPPLLFQAASDEEMATDTTRAAERARQAGVQVECRLFDEAFHVFQMMVDLPESREALIDVGRFFKRHTGAQ